MMTASTRIAGRMRERIVRGIWKPGSRLPNRQVLIRELDASAAVVQEAVDQLVVEGFVEVGARRLGTRVAPHPPHLSRYRLVFPFGPHTWGQFWHALEAAAAARTTPEREFSCFYGLGGHRDIAEYQAVVDEVRARSLAGLIFASSANELTGTPLLEVPGIPRAAIALKHDLPGIPKVSLDLEHFLRQAVDILIAKGRRKIAILCASRAPQYAELFRAALSDHGLHAFTRWVQFASMQNPAASCNVMELLFHAGQTELPDGLIIADDNLLSGAATGLVRSGIGVPQALDVVALTNFPNIVATAVPVTRLGFDIPRLLDLLTERIEQLTHGDSPPEHTLLPGITESEFHRCRLIGKDKIESPCIRKMYSAHGPTAQQSTAQYPERPVGRVWNKT